MALLELLRQAQRFGLLGPAPVEDHLVHAEAFRDAVSPPARALDLGSGTGIPGLALALAWPASDWVLLDASARRTAFLDTAVTRLGLAERVTVRRQRAEEAGRQPEFRGTCDLVVARAFGPPAVTAECASPFLRVGGHLVVSEPPEGGDDRWPPEGVAQLGLRLGEPERAGPRSVRVLEQAVACPDRFPRRVGIAAKRPLWTPDVSRETSNP